MQTRLSILGLTKYDPTIWSGFAVPAGVVRQDVIDYICMQCAELGLVYTDPDTVRKQIRLWSRSNADSWFRMWTAIQEQYNPLHNYDRHEDWSDTGSASATGQNKTSVAGFNQGDGLADRDQTDQQTSSQSAGTHSGHLYGNIGVTTNAQMLNEELDVRQRTNFYWILTTSFKQEFCIQIY